MQKAAGIGCCWRRLSGGKPAGFKLCVGHQWEFLALCKAMIETGIYPDFIVVDGKEGGTGAAPLEFIYEEKLRIARDVVERFHAAGIECELGPVYSTH
jgi:hypothetical protein